MRPITALLPGLLLLLGGCESLQSTDSLLGIVTPYRIDIVQGNVVTKEQVAALRNGMSRSQVRDIMGTPLLTDPFHADRWDYVFTIRRQGTEPQRRSVVLLFAAGVLAEVQAPELPSEQDFVASITRPRQTKVPRLELSEEERLALPSPSRADTPGAAAAEPTGPVREYPPLEPA